MKGLRYARHELQGHDDEPKMTRRTAGLSTQSVNHRNNPCGFTWNKLLKKETE